MRAPTMCAFGGGASDAAVRHGRIYNPPLRARLRPSRRGGLYGRPEPGSDSRRGSMVALAVGARSAVMHPNQRCGMGGYIIRPYGPACGLLVGAACMAARNQVPIRAGVRWLPSAVGARSAVMHPNLRCGIGRIYNPPLRTCPRSFRRGGRKNTAQWGCHCAVGITGNTKGEWRRRRPAGRRR